MSYLLLKFSHILSSTLLFGTGLGTAFHGLLAYRTEDPRVVAVVGRSVVLADWVFTAPSVIVQPLTGIMLMRAAGYPWTTGWLLAAIVLYVLVGACWLPVVWLQIQLRRMAVNALAAGTALPDRFFRLSRIWFLLGWPAFTAVLGIFYLMIFKPEF
jgi:uncharacterized membrane protein